MRLFVVAMSAVFLQGCFPPPPPAISDIPPSTVRVQAQVNPFYETDLNAVDAEAQRGCGIYGKQPNFISSRCILFDELEECMVLEFLYICVAARQ